MRTYCTKGRKDRFNRRSDTSNSRFIEIIWIYITIKYNTMYKLGVASYRRIMGMEAPIFQAHSEFTTLSPRCLEGCETAWAIRRTASRLSRPRLQCRIWERRCIGSSIILLSFCAVLPKTGTILNLKNRCRQLVSILR